MGCGAPGTFHAFLLLPVFVSPLTLENTFQGDSNSGPLRTKRGVAKGSLENKGLLSIQCLQHVDTTMFPGRIAILRLGCGLRLCSSSPRRILGRKREIQIEN